jgi:hypothetical protein
MAHVLATCDFYLEHIPDHNHPMHVPILCSICVMYARPFTDNAGVGMISRKFGKYNDARLQTTHDVLLRSRKEFYAHSDATLTAKMTSGAVQSIQPIDVVVSRRSTPEGMLFSFGYQLHELRLHSIVIPDVRDLCRELESRLAHEIRVTLDRLFTPMTPEIARMFAERDENQLAIRIEFPASDAVGSNEAG